MPIDKSLNLSNVNAGYGKTIVVEDVSLEVAPGNILTLLGPNGSGKSTILKTICMELTKLGGTVTLKGQDIESLDRNDVAKTLSVMLTDRPKPEYMTCRDVVEMGRIPYTGTFGKLTPSDEKVVRETMEMVNILEIADRDFRNISDGQRQRVMLARAIAQEPEVLIMDEPTTFLDVHYKIELLWILRKLVREKKLAVILSLHELELAGKVSDQVLCIENGKVGAYGPTEEIFKGEYIKTLYGIREGEYIESFATLELPKVEGAPRVFVISGNGGGIPLFHKLWRKNIPFSCGILFENDREYPIAKALSVQTVETPSYEPISEEDFERARTLIDSVEQVICRVETFGTFNDKNRLLMEYAKSKGKLVEDIYG